MLPRAAILTTGALVLAAGARAADGEPTIAERVRAYEADRGHRVYGLARVHWDYPLGLSGGSGILITELPRDYDCTTTCPVRGFTLQGTVGLGGAEVAAGFASMVAETGKSRSFLRHVYVGYGVRAAYVRTWGASNLAPEGDDFLGLEAAFTIAQFSLTAGVFRRVPADDPGDGTKVFAGLGWGF